MSYPLLGDLPVVPAADLLSLTAPVNRRGPARVNGAFGANNEGEGKRAAQFVIRDSGAGDRYSLVFATGAAPDAVWLAVDGATKYTPV